MPLYDSYDALGLDKSDKSPTQAMVDAAYRRNMLSLKTALIAGDPEAAQKMLNFNLARDDFKKWFGKQWAADVVAREIVETKAKETKPVEIQSEPIKEKPVKVECKPAEVKPEPLFEALGKNNSSRRPTENWVLLTPNMLPDFSLNY